MEVPGHHQCNKSRNRAKAGRDIVTAGLRRKGEGKRERQTEKKRERGRRERNREIAEKEDEF